VVKHLILLARVCPLPLGVVVGIVDSSSIRKVSLWFGHGSLQSAEFYLRADPTESSKHSPLAVVTPPSLQRGRFRAPGGLLVMLRAAEHGNGAAVACALSDLAPTSGDNRDFLFPDDVILLRGYAVEGAKELQPRCSDAMARAGAMR
jgi:hypothetical protein